MIKILDKSVYELIAAGEVIEKPASVIKELVENSIDAGATRITVEIRGGGIELMKVSDNGCGIPYSEIPTAFLRHATSKVSGKSDLENILSLGFRGEALASVCAVSRVQVISKTKDSGLGTKYVISGDIEEVYEETGCADGTVFVITDLFYNVPARRNFLKKESIEALAIVNIVEKIALSHPDISIKMIKDGETVFNSPGQGGLYTAIYTIYGKIVAEDMLLVSHEESGIKVEGYTIKPLYAKGKRSYQNFFVNGRYVQSMLLRNAVEEAYQSLIMHGKFPAFVINITLSPSLIDVNIHPAKAEVRFSEEKSVRNAVYFAIKNAFISKGLLYNFKIDEDVRETVEMPKYEAVNLDNIFYDTNKHTQTVLPDNNLVYKYEQIADITPAAVEEFEPLPPPREIIIDENDYLPRENSEEIPPEIHVIGEYNKSYIIAETDSGLVIIDKHAAHERIIYERLKEETVLDSQYLLIPFEIMLTTRELGFAKNNIHLLERMGFFVEIGKYFKITAVPQIFQGLDIDFIADEVIKNIITEKIEPQSQKLDELYHSMACKAAIKARDNTKKEELQTLAEQVYSNPEIRHCPHGRPIIFILTPKEIEKQFKRII